MEGVKEKQGQLVFGLDIGTRSIVGTVGYLNGGKFHVLAQRSKEHETRAMLDGQIHDIGKVGETISQVKEQLEADLGRELTEVCIAAAGRVLRTVTTYVEHSFESDREITQEDVYSLCTMGVEKAYEEFQNSNTDTDMKFYCVGYTAMRYYMNGYQMGNLEGHKAKNIAVDLIATFLPDDVVDGLYKAVELAGLHVANLTLEPIAAIQVAIPENGHARRLMAARYLITGQPYRPNLVCGVFCPGRWAEELRRSYHEEVCGGLNYARTADGTTDVCLVKLLNELSEDEYRHAERLMTLLERSLGRQSGC